MRGVTDARHAMRSSIECRVVCRFAQKAPTEQSARNHQSKKNSETGKKTAKARYSYLIVYQGIPGYRFSQRRLATTPKLKQASGAQIKENARQAEAVCTHQVVKVLAASQERDWTLRGGYGAQGAPPPGVAVEFGDDHRPHRHGLCSSVRSFRC